MDKEKVTNREEYDAVMKRIEYLLQKSTLLGGFEKLPENDTKALQQLSIAAEQYEDSIPLMPIKQPNTLTEMLRYKMFELNIKQKQLAELVGVSETRISELMNGKRRLTIELAKKLNAKLNIDADFLLRVA